jgi:hypothetical protein
MTMESTLHRITKHGDLNTHTMSASPLPRYETEGPKLYLLQKDDLAKSSQGAPGGILGNDERRSQQPGVRTIAVEDKYSLPVKLLCLAAYFLCNLALTISNKALLGHARYPWLLTTTHASATSFGCYMMAGLGTLKVGDMQCVLTATSTDSDRSSSD